MPSLLEIGLANAVCATVLASLAVLAGRVCRRPAVMHGLWLLVLLKLVTPPLLPLKLDVLPASRPAPVTVATTTIQPSPMVAEPVTTGQFLMLPAQENGDVLVAVKLNTTPWIAPAPIDEPKQVPATDSASSSRIDWNVVARMLTAGWLGGAVVWFAMALIRTWRFQRLLGLATAAPPEMRDRAEQLATQLGLTRCPRIALLPGAIPPMLWMAIGRPTVYLPSDLLRTLDPGEIDSLLAHELAHLRRRDHLVRWLEFVVQGIYWWNPLVPLVRRAMQAHEEECCDALVVTVVPPRPYATAIVRTLDFLAGAEPLSVPVSGLSRVMAMKKRLTQIMRGGVAGRLGVIGRVGLISWAVAALPLLPTLTSQSVGAAVRSAPEHEQNDDDEQPEVDDGTNALPVDATPRAMGYTSDGQRLALALDDGSVEIREATSTTVSMTLVGHVGPVNCVVFAPTGELVATAGSDRTVRLWNARNGEPVATLRGHTHWVYALAFAPDGRGLISGGYDRTVRVWDVPSRTCLGVLRGHTAAVRSLAYAPDGRSFASGGGDGAIRLWDAGSRRLRSTLTGHTDSVRVVAFSPDGRTLASGGDDGMARLWDPATGSERASLPVQGNEITSLAFAPWGHVLATAGRDPVTRLWSVPDGRSLGAIPAPRDGLAALAFAPGSGTLTTLGHDHQLRHLRLHRVEVLAAESSALEFRSIPRPAEFRRLAARVQLMDDAPRMVLVEVVRMSKGVRTVE